MDFKSENVINDIGFGRWQLPTVLMPGILHLGECFQTISASILNAQVAFRCSDDENDLDILGERFGDHNYYDSKCRSINGSNIINDKQFNNSVMESCPVIQYDKSVFRSTATTEFDLICEDAPLRAFFQAAFFFGGMTGSFSNGILGDKFGRKTVLRIAVLLYIITSGTLSFASNYFLVVLSRYLTGIFAFMSYLSSYCLAIEVVPTKHRSATGLLPGIFYGIGVAIFATEGYFYPEWRYLNIFACAPAFLALPLLFFVDESPRWLLQKNRHNEAIQVFTKGAKLNQVTISYLEGCKDSSEEKNSNLEKLLPTSNEKAVPCNEIHSESEKPLYTTYPIESKNISISLGSTEIQSNIETSEVNKRKEDSCGSISGLLLLFRSKTMRKRSIPLFMMWIFTGALYYGILLNASNFTKTNVFLYVLILGLLEIPAILIAIPLSNHFSRRLVVGGSLLFAGIFTLIELITPNDWIITRWILVMTAFLLVGIAYNVNYVYAPELFPTIIRARGSSLCTVMGNIGSFLAPIITDVIATLHWSFVGILLGSSGVIAGLLVTALPETKDCPLPDTIQDIEETECKNNQKKNEIQI